jgi:hypothetical protein
MRHALLTFPDDERTEALLAFLRTLDFVQIDPLGSPPDPSHRLLLDAWADAQAGRNLVSVDWDELQTLLSE